MPTVILLAHSMGGLVARSYLTSGGDAKVAKLITLSTPHLGAPKAWYAHLMGYTFGNPFVAQGLMKMAGRNMPGPYELLPWQPFVLDTETGHQWDLVQTYRLNYHGIEHSSQGILPDTYDLTTDWPWRLNLGVLAATGRFRQQLGTRAPAGVPTWCVVGYGIATLDAYHALKPSSGQMAQNPPHVLDTPDRSGSSAAGGTGYYLRPVFGNGDGTVPLWSLEGISGATMFYVADSPADGASHAKLTANVRAQALLRGILDDRIRGQADAAPEFRRPSDDGLRLQQPGDVLECEVLCPADLHLYDAAGKHLGNTKVGTIEETLPRGSLITMADRSYAAVVHPAGVYRLRLAGRGSGAATLVVRLGGSAALTCEPVPLGRGSTAEVVLDVASLRVAPPTLSATVDGRTVSVKPRVAGSEPPPPTVVVTPPAPAARVFTYREITAFTDALAVGSGVWPALSRNGARLALSFAPDPADPQKRPRVGSIRADGSDFRFVDAYVPLTASALRVDISADGRWIESDDGRQIRVVAADGGTARRVIALDGGLLAVRLSPDGRTVYFTVAAKSVVTGTATRVSKGLYAVQADGSGLRQLADENAIARVVGVPAGEVGALFSASRGQSLDVSDDGRRLVVLVSRWGMRGNGHVLTVGTDGSGLKQVGAPEGDVIAVGTSGDGGTVVFVTSQPNGLRQGWVLDGSGSRKLSERAFGECALSLTADGAAAVFGHEGVLWRRDGSGGPALATPCGVMAGRLGGARLDHLAVDRSGRQGVYVVWDAHNRAQLVRVDVDPADLAGAPALSDVAFPATVPADGRTNSVVSVQVKSGQTVLGGRVVAFVGAVPDDHLGRAAYLNDKGQDGDLAAGDGVFTGGQLRADATAAPGPHTLRVTVETRTADDRRLATALEVGPVNVTVAR